MQPHQLQYFVAVAETGSFTAGAWRVRVVQSAVSAAVRQLEHELGVALFVRGRRAELTPEGALLLPRARDVLAAIEAAGAAVAATRGKLTGTVNFGMMFHLAGFDLVSHLASLQRKHPDIVVRGRASTAGSREHLDAVRRGNLDLALVAAASDTAPGLNLRPLASEPFRFVCPASHRLAGSRIVRLEQIADEVFIDSPLGWGTRSLVDSAFAQAGLHRTVRTESIDFALTQALVREQLGVALIPASAVSTDPGLVALDIEPAISFTIRLAYPATRPLSAAATALAADLELGALTPKAVAAD